MDSRKTISPFWGFLLFPEEPERGKKRMESIESHPAFLTGRRPERHPCSLNKMEREHWDFSLKRMNAYDNRTFKRIPLSRLRPALLLRAHGAHGASRTHGTKGKYRTRRACGAAGHAGTHGSDGAHGASRLDRAHREHGSGRARRGTPGRPDRRDPPAPPDQRRQDRRRAGAHRRTGCHGTCGYNRTGRSAGTHRKHGRGGACGRYRPHGAHGARQALL